MKKHLIRIFTILILCIIIVSNIMPEVYGIVNNPGAYADNGTSSETAQRVGNLIVGVVRTVGSSLAVLLLVIVGIKYIIGSTQEKAEYKQTMIPYIIGAVLIFAGSQVTQIIYEAVTKAG